MALATQMLIPSLMVAVVQSFSGEETHCIGPRSHAAAYNFDGLTLEGARNAFVSIRRTPESDHLCKQMLEVNPQGDKAFCIGANVDPTCTKAAKDEPLNTNFDCKNCFAGATTDLFYSINISDRRLQFVKVGLQNTHLRGAVEMHGAASGSVTPLNGSLQLVSSHPAKISFKVAKLFPVDITVGMPTVLDYSLTVDGSIDASVGADLDIDLGDHYVQWTKENGFGVINTTASVKVTPVLDVNAQAKADFQSSLQVGAQIDVDKVLWYHLNLGSKLSTDVDTKEKSIFHPFQKPQVCTVVGAAISAAHEADLHFTLLGKNREIAHFGPKDLYQYHNSGIINKCVNIPSSTLVI